MSAKLLHSLTDDNPDLQKQIGCMTGIFQLFDRQHIIAPRGITGHSPNWIPHGSSHFNSNAYETESNNKHPRPSGFEKQSNKNVQDKQRVSTESSRPSFSSSSRSSSFSSLDCNRTGQPESLSFDRIVFPETPSKDAAMRQSSASPQFGRQTLDLRDVVKDSMYREARGLSVKTAVKDHPTDCIQNHQDSPRSQRLSKTNDGAYNMGLNGMQNTPVDLKESLRVLAKLREAPWYCNEPRELSRSSSNGYKDGSSFTIAKDALRFSYDGGEISRSSFESGETSKASMKLKELPRLSLDSREGSVRSFKSDSKPNLVSGNSHRESGNSSDEILNLQQTSVTQTRPTGVVAKLMGLESLPDSGPVSDGKVGSFNSQPVKDFVSSSRSSDTTNLLRPMNISDSSRNSWKEPTSPRWKNPDLVMKPISRFPNEQAPWKQADGTRGSQKAGSRHFKSPAKAPHQVPSVYDEIEKRLKDLEFTQSGKDLRALKQILEAMQVKGLLATRKEEQDSSFVALKDNELLYASSSPDSRFLSQQKPQRDHNIATANRGSNSSKSFNSPIVIMKPAKLVKKSGIPASSVIRLDGLSSLHKPKSGEFSDNRKGSINVRAAKDQIPKTNRRDNAVNSIDMNTNSRNSKLTHTSTRSQQLSRESNTNTVKNSGSIGPRLQQKKLDLEKRSRPPTPPSDSSKSRRQPNKQQQESSSPGGRRRPKSFYVQQSEDQFSDVSSETRNSTYQETSISLQLDSKIVSDPKTDMEFTSSDRSGEINGKESPSMKAAKYSQPGLVEKKLKPLLCEDDCLAELAIVGPEYPSPVSVLDDAVYIDDAPSPVRQIPKTLKDEGYENSNTVESQNPAADHISNTMRSGLTSEINRQKLHNIHNLVQNLRRLNSSHDEVRTDYIASLCENSKPDDRYISEILLASGLLLRDLGSSLSTFQFHPSGHPINPELFLVLEQTKVSVLLKEECSTEKVVVKLKADKENFHRKLIFDAVNEILAGKLALVGHSPEPWLRPDKLVRKTLNAQRLLRELCMEIEQLQVNKPECSNLECEEDGYRSILWKDVMCRSESWTSFYGDISGVVLDVERSLFKDLVDEIVVGEAAGLRAKAGMRRRRLFV